MTIFGKMSIPTINVDIIFGMYVLYILTMPRTKAFIKCISRIPWFISRCEKQECFERISEQMIHKILLILKPFLWITKKNYTSKISKFILLLLIRCNNREKKNTSTLCSMCTIYGFNRDIFFNGFFAFYFQKYVDFFDHCIFSL